MKKIRINDQITYDILLLSEGTLLDNYAFNGDEKETAEKYNAPLKHAGADNDVGTKLYRMALYCIVAEKVTGRRVKPKEKKFCIKLLYY